MRKTMIIILGIDCLDYNLVNRWKMRYYKLGNFGYYFVGSELYTPIIWAKFLTGIDVTKYGFNMKRLSLMKRIKSLYYLRYLFTFLSDMIGKIHRNGTKNTKKKSRSELHIIRKIFYKLITTNNYDELSLNEKILLKLLLKAAYTERLTRKLLMKTFVYDAVVKRKLKVLCIEFPTINDNIYLLVRNILYFYIGASPEERQIFLDYVWKVTNMTLDILVKNISNYDIILWYTPIIDIASHMFYNPKSIIHMSKLYAIYKKLGEKIENIITEIHDDKAIIMIVSDHGYNPIKQDHSHFGYWSINTKIMQKPETVLDFSPLIKNLLLK